METKHKQSSEQLIAELVSALQAMTRAVASSDRLTDTTLAAMEKARRAIRLASL